ncbi:hypothetical protein ABLO27_13460 [Roseibium sp. SCPC15]|uniref:hypothetical protein n=1 Tax=Roseibium sp. SCP15 TaxID=3141376 RepID=UPI00333DB0F7
MPDEFLYFKCRWPEVSVPNGEPEWMHYEVVKALDVVTRTVDFYADGDAVRNSIELSEREGPDQRLPEHRSLVHGPFLKIAYEGLISMTQDEFQVLWESARDKPWHLEDGPTDRFRS